MLACWACDPEFESDLAQESFIETVVDSNISLIGDFLQFNSQDFYEGIGESPGLSDELIKTIDQIENFISIKEVTEDMESSFITTILNQQGIVKIDRWIFKIDLDNGTVDALEEKNLPTHYRLLVDGQSSPEIFVFSTSDEVLVLLKEGRTGSPNERTKLFCRKCSSIDWRTPRLYINTLDYYEARSRFVNAGVWFEFSHHLYYAQATTVLYVPRPTAHEIYNYTKSCKRGGYFSDDLTITMPYGGVQEPYYNGQIINYKHKIYEGFTGLKQLDLTVS